MKIRYTSALLFTVFLTSFLLSGCNGTEDKTSNEDGINSERLLENIKTLSSDEFEGRQPASIGEEKTKEFLSSAFRNAGVEPGNGTSYFQEVPLVATTVSPNIEASLVMEDESRKDLLFRDEVVLWTKRIVDSIEVSDSEMVFVGYGINAPEFGWNDYEGLDVKGKTVLILVNDPGYHTQDEDLFNGNSMTYYGRWTYKFEEAARQGAEAVLLIHITGPAGYPWEVIEGSWTGPQFNLISEDNNMSRAAVEGWVHHDLAKLLFEGNKMDLDSVVDAASKPGFKAFNLPSSFSTTFTNDFKRSMSSNILGVIKGTEMPDEYVMYVAHWDHFGKDTSREGDQILNGALDNATGTAGLLELAHKFTANPPKRSVVFLAVTAEEQGLLGSAYYANNPIYPLNKTVAILNMDAMNVFGPTSDFTIVGYGNSQLDQLAEEMGKEQNRTAIADPSPEKGFFFRSDHFSFAKQGVPSLYMESGVTHLTEDKDYIPKKWEDYTANDYHKPSDEVKESWDMEGLVLDIKLFYLIGNNLANSNEWPEWNEGVAFKAARDEMMKK